MSVLKSTLLAAAVAMVYALPASAQTVITPKGEIKAAKMKGSKMPKNAKPLAGNMMVVVMGDKTYLVPLTREFNEMFTW